GPVGSYGARLALAARFARDLLHRREHVLEHGALGEADLRAQLHAGEQRVRRGAGLQLLRAQLDQRAIGERRASRLGRAALARIGGDLQHAALEHAVALEGKARELHLYRLPGAHEADILVLQPHLRQQRLAVRDDGHEHRARREHAAARVGGEVLHQAVRRRAQLAERAPVAQLFDLLREAHALPFRVDALRSQLRLVVRGELPDAALRLLQRGARAFDAVLLRAQVLLELHALAHALVRHQLAGKAFLR